MASTHSVPISSPLALVLVWFVYAFVSTSLAQSSDLPTITAVGSKFFFSNGSQYYVKGIAYQLTPDDPLSNPTQCKLDASLMANLGANTIRVYHVDPTADHDECMTAFADRGIYLFLDLDTFTTQFEQTTPYWNETQLTSFTTVLDAFQGYSNLAGVFIANEALTFLNTSSVAPFIKSSIRDVKAYRDSKKYRPIPIGYAGADVADLRPMLQNYLACGSPASPDSNDVVTADFFALNVYEWCGQSSFKGSGYNDLVKNATDLQIPIFISETGCREPRPRLFDDQDSIFGKDMENTWSGAIIYEWLQEANDYGLISYGPKVDEADETALDGYPRTGTPKAISPDFNNLKSHWATLHPKGVKLDEYSATAEKLKAVACPTMMAGGWEVDPTAPLPSLGQTLDTAAASRTGAGAVPSETKKGGSVKTGAGLVWAYLVGFVVALFFVC